MVRTLTRLLKASVILRLALSVLECAASVRTGLDNVGAHKRLFMGKRVGIITNHTAYTGDNRYIVDVFKDMPGVTVTALFSPEHGLHGTKQAGIAIDGKTDPTYRLPIYSLYGAARKPTPRMLRDVDILVFDIQDIGARFYTYIYTMSLAMEAAAECGKRFVVLDRPNPINGLQVEGNILQKKFASFVGLHPIAVRHGMTVGELAKMFSAEGWLAGGIRVDLVVIEMSGWRRRMWFDQTGLRFIKPSPNISNWETAIIYPGLCLLEGTNVSEARGTELPFRQFGAPWIDAQSLAARLNELTLPGLEFAPASFTPKSSKYAGQECHGARINITGRDAVQAYYSGIQIVSVVHQMCPDKFEWRAEHFDRLCGTSMIREAIVSRSSLAMVRESWQERLKAFLQIRRKYLIYPQ